MLSYEEKPVSAKGDWASLTVLCFKPKILYDMLLANQEQSQGSYEFGRDIIPMMVREGFNVHGYKFKGYWGYTRTVDEYWQTSMDLLGQEPKIDMEKWGLRTNLEHRDIRDCQPLRVGAQGVLDNAMAFNGCTVEGRVTNSILFPGVTGGDRGAEVRDSVLFFNTVVQGRGKTLQSCQRCQYHLWGRSRVGVPRDESFREYLGDWLEQPCSGWDGIGSGCTVYPRISPDSWPAQELADREVLQ